MPYFSLSTQSVPSEEIRLGMQVEVDIVPQTWLTELLQTQTHSYFAVSRELSCVGSTSRYDLSTANKGSLMVRLFEELSFNQILAMYIGRKSLSAARSALPAPWHITRWVAGMLARHEDKLVPEIAELAGYRFLVEVPALDVVAAELNLDFCKSIACLPVHKDNKCLGIAVCDPSLLESRILRDLEKITSILLLWLPCSVPWNIVRIFN
jgi:hypothetical protein